MEDLMGSWPYGIADGPISSWPYAPMALWTHGLMGSWPYGVIALSRHDLMASAQIREALRADVRAHAATGRL